MDIIGHRGACAYAPENTISSFDLAQKMGCSSIETDIRATKDGVLVLLHDHTVDRTTNGSGRIKELTIEEVKELDAGTWFSDDFKGEKIPTLREFLSHYGNQMEINLEIKEKSLEKKVLKAIKAQKITKENLIITSFSFNILMDYKRLDNNYTYGYLVKSISLENIKECVKHKIDYICPNASYISSEDVLTAHTYGLFVRAWGVKSELVMKKTVAAGVDGMTVDFPDKLIAYIS